jgi:hypothetical protein
MHIITIIHSSQIKYVQLDVLVWYALDDVQVPPWRLVEIVVWTSLGRLPRWVPGPTTRWAPGTTRLALHGT